MAASKKTTTGKPAAVDRGANAAAKKARELQAQQDRLDTQRPAKKPRAQPAPGPGHEEPAEPLPTQHLAKPGTHEQHVKAGQQSHKNS